MAGDLTVGEDKKIDDLLDRLRQCETALADSAVDTIVDLRTILGELGYTLGDPLDGLAHTSIARRRAFMDVLASARKMTRPMLVDWLERELGQEGDESGKG